MHSATATHLTSERGENLSRDAQNAMFKAADTVPAGDSVQSLQLSQKQFCPSMFEFGKRLIFLLCSQSNFKIQVQKNCRDNSMKYQGSHVNNLCQNRSGDISFEESWLYISVALGFLHTISMSDPVCCSARSHCSSIRRVVS